MELVRYGHALDFLAAARPYLDARESSLALLYGVAHRLSASAEAGYFAAFKDGPRVAGVAAQSPSGRVLLSQIAGDGCALLADDLVARAQPLSGALGPPDTTQRFTEQTGRPVLRRQRQVAYTLHDVRARSARAPGRARLATTNDLAVVEAWGRRFASEIQNPPLSAPDATAMIGRRVVSRTLYVWDGRPREAGAGPPLAMATAAPQTPRSVRLALVYSPPECRGRGYASALVASLSEEALRAGCTFCSLSTLAADAAAARLYRRVGYEPETELDEVWFEGRYSATE